MKQGEESKKDDQLAKLALAAMSIELIKVLIELIVKLIDLLGGR